MKRNPLLLTPLFFALLTLILTYPLALHLTTYVADTGDPLLNTWALRWGQQAWLRPWFSISDLFDANAFYPYRHSLGFSEHLLLYAALTLPLQALDLGPVFAHNAAIIFSLAAAGWGMALLVTHWTGSRWAGLIAGIIFAFVPARLNHWAHLHQLSIQWLPLIILTLDRWLTRGQRGDLVLFAIFLNLQLLSTVNYIPQTIILVGLFLLFGWLRSPARFFSKEAAAGGLVTLSVTVLLNWPIAKIYFDLSELQGFDRSLGDARIYGAALIDYLTPPPENILYGGWLTARLVDPARPLVPLFMGIVTLILVIVGGLSIRSKSNGHRLSGRRLIIAFLLLLTLLVVMLSFGTNELALGRELAPVTQKMLPYRWLFEYVPGFSGLRIPARMAILAFFGLAGLAGFGVAHCIQRFHLPAAAAAVVALLIVVEYLAVPLAGTHVPIHHNIPLVYQYLAAGPDKKTVIELPYDLAEGGANELPRLYYSSYGWYDLINGASGFNPGGLQDLSRQLRQFPDANSFDILGQMGVTHLVLHAAEFGPVPWQDIWSKLPSFMPAIESVSQFGDDYLLALRPPRCSPQSAWILVQPARLDDQLALSFTNNGPAAFFARPQSASRVQAGNRVRQFLMPLFIPAGETQTLDNVVSLPEDFGGKVKLNLPNLAFQGEVALGDPLVSPTLFEDVGMPEMPLHITFGDDLRLRGYTLHSKDGPGCRIASLRLYWATGAASPPDNTRSIVRVVDRFGQTAAHNVNYPWKYPSLSTNEFTVDEHLLPVVETTPAGQYGLVLGLFSENGQSYRPSNTGTLPANADEVLLSDFLVRPTSWPADLTPDPVGTFENGITLLGYQLDQRPNLVPGDWLRLTLYWRANRPVPNKLTVFTQLVDSNGRVWGQYDNPPRAGWYPTPLWQPGEIVGDDYLIQLDPAAPVTALGLLVGFYDPDTLARLAVVDDNGHILGDHLRLTVLNVISGGRR